MIHLNTSLAQSALDRQNIAAAETLSAASLQSLQQQTGAGKEWLGWRRILKQPDDALISELESLAASIRSEADVFIVCGIGGSYLGARAVIDALGGEFRSDKVEIVYAGHHMGAAYLKRLVAYLSKPKPDGSTKSVFLNVISKSGTTMETALGFRVLRKWMDETYGNDAGRRIICTTSEKGGALNQVISANRYRKFVLPDDVGGRFSVLTPVGLLPIAVAGFDIRTLFYGAVAAYQTYEKAPAPVLNYAATRFALYKNGFKVDIMASFEPELRSFGGWFQQLFGESEGKGGKGLFPAVVAFSSDLHSLGQQIQDGERNLAETFLAVTDHPETVTIPLENEDFDGLNYLAGRPVHEINATALEGTIQAHVAGKVPVTRITLDRLDEEHLGALIYFFELACAVYVYNLEENPFDQPGVEAYKKNMYKLLGKL
jgi:glucose-6-phosphate isomerase